MKPQELKAAIRDGARTIADAARWKRSRTQDEARRLRAAAKNSFRA